MYRTLDNLLSFRHYAQPTTTWYNINTIMFLKIALNVTLVLVQRHPN